MTSKFYVDTSSDGTCSIANTKDYSSIVQRHLKSSEFCETAIKCQAYSYDNDAMSMMIVALIRHSLSENPQSDCKNYEYGIFVYNENSKESLELKKTFTVNENFELIFKHVKDKKSSKTMLLKGATGAKIIKKDCVTVEITDTLSRLILDLPNSTNFLEILKKARSFATDSSCAWIYNNYVDVFKDDAFDSKKIEIAKEAVDLVSNRNVWSTDDGNKNTNIIDFGFEDHFATKSSVMFSDNSEKLNEPNLMSGREMLRIELMNKRRSEYTNNQKFDIFCGTWNVNGLLPNDEKDLHLNEWLRQDKASDIYAIGFQELDLNVTSHVFDNQTKELKWKKFLENYFQSCPITKNEQVQFVTSMKLVAIVLFIFAKKKHLPMIKDIRKNDYPTGIGGILGNKGGVAVGFKLHDTSLCFISAHLAAHQEYADERTKQFKTIFERLELNSDNAMMNLYIDNYDGIFWMGDLNYRLDMKYENVIEFIKQNDNHPEFIYDGLKKYDQFVKQRELSDCILNKFQESPIEFLPTYKFDAGTNVFDTSEKGRIPSYCDRILYKGATIQPLKYDSHPEILMSDHKPVSCHFTIDIGVIDVKKYNQINAHVQTYLDNKENEMLPRCTITPQDICFDAPLIVGQESKATIKLVNTGLMMFGYNFKNQMDSKKCCSDWINIHPKTGTVSENNSKSIEISINVQYDQTELFFNKYKQQFEMEEVLILDLINGCDKFITIKAILTPSIFGLSLMNACKLSGRACELTTIDYNRIIEDENILINCPKELVMLIAVLIENLPYQGLFPKEPSPKNMELVRMAIDSLDYELLKDLAKMDVQAVSGMLYVYLKSLPEPIIIRKHYDNCIQAYQQFLLLKQLITDMPEPHQQVFEYLVKFLAKVVSCQSGTIKELAYLFSSCILSPNISISMKQNDRMKRMKILETFIEKAYKGEL